MKVFNTELLKPKGGRLDALLFKNSYLNIPETLFFSIEIDLHEFTLENNPIETSIILNFIKFDINQLKELQEQIFIFPINPVEGYIDGSLYLFNVHNPFDVNKIELKTITNNSIDITLHYIIDFEYESTGFKKSDNCTLKTKLNLGDLSIDQDILNKGNFNADYSKKIASQFISLEGFAEPEIVDEQIKFKMQY